MAVGGVQDPQTGSLGTTGSGSASSGPMDSGNPQMLELCTAHYWLWRLKQNLGLGCPHKKDKCRVLSLWGGPGWSNCLWRSTCNELLLQKILILPAEDPAVVWSIASTWKRGLKRPKMWQRVGGVVGVLSKTESPDSLCKNVKVPVWLTTSFVREVSRALQSNFDFPN